MGGLEMILLFAHCALGATPGSDEIANATAWSKEIFGFSAQHHPQNTNGTDLPFSFTYGGKSSRDFLASWKTKRHFASFDKQRERCISTYTDPETKLQVRCEAVAYSDFPVVEWTLYFKNTGKQRTPILTDILSTDTGFQCPEKGEYTLHRHRGDFNTADSYEPFDEPLKAGTTRHITNTNGRPTQSEFPYWNIEWPSKDGKSSDGLIFVVSWSGQWKADFVRNKKNGLQLRAGQETARFYLEPGEEVRTPMTVLQFWKGNRLHAQNVWRAWMIVHNIPRPGGSLPPLPQLCACSSHQFGEMINANTENQKLFVDKYAEHGIKLDYWWMDAGWYPNKTGWTNTGTWEVDTERFPKGLREISDYARKQNVKTIVWFEPERVTEDTWIMNTHPEWVLPFSKLKPGEKKWGLLNLGDPKVRKWLTNHVDKLITKQGIDLYRQDYNIDPLPFWQANDTDPDRQGITEIRHVKGYFAYWDALRKRHPNMLIDSCASGGRRNDLETLRRAVPLLRSDYIMEPVGNQCHTYTLAQWFPFYGTGTSKTSTYEIRSTLCPGFIACWDQRDETIDHALFKRLVDQWRSYGKYYFGDFYPLTRYSLANDQWIAWQFDCPETGEGMVEVFRRAESIYETARLPLEALDPAAGYTVTNIDGGTDRTLDGKELRERGLEVKIGEKPGTAIFVYKKTR